MSFTELSMGVVARLVSRQTGVRMGGSLYPTYSGLFVNMVRVIQFGGSANQYHYVGCYNLSIP